MNAARIIKRIQRKSLQAIENGRTQLNITVVSDNDAYKPIDVTLRDETLNETTVLARAVWLGVKLP
jgi:phage repressor protein C with HTH and peptisase S24 domain